VTSHLEYPCSLHFYALFGKVMKFNLYILGSLLQTKINILDSFN